MRERLFETHESAEIKHLSAMVGTGRHVWGWVTQTIARPWFHAMAELRDGESSIKQTVFLATVGQVMLLQDMAEITHLDLVSPGYLNGSDRWEMRPLAEILEGQEPSGRGPKAHVYVTTSGDRYVDSFVGAKESELLNLRTIIRMSDHLGGRPDK